MTLRNRRIQTLLMIACSVVAGLSALSGPSLAQSPDRRGRDETHASSFSPAFGAGTFEEIDGKILVRVKLNDLLDTRFLLDSGSWNSLLSPDAARTLNIAFPSSDVAGKIRKVALGPAVLTDVGVLRENGITISNWNKAHPNAPISGLLGLDLLERHALGLDFTTHTYGLWLGGKIPRAEAKRFNSVVCAAASASPYTLAPGASLRVGPITLANSAMQQTTPQAFPMERVGSEERYHAQIQLNDRPVKVFLDTGAAGLSVTDSIATAIEARPYSAANTGGRSATQASTPPLFYVRSFRLGTFETLVNFITVVHRSEEDPTDTRLGVNSAAFAHCRVVLDFPGHTLYLSPYDRAASVAAERKPLTQLFDRGLFVPPDAKTAHAALHIGQGSPAEKAGLKDGDELLEFGGKSPTTLASLPSGSAPRLEQAPIQVTVRRQGQFEKQVFTLSSDYNGYIPTNIYFTGDPPPFPDDWLQPPISAEATFLDPARDSDEITRAQRIIREELSRYSPAMLQQNLRDVYIVRSLSEEGTAVGGLNSPEEKKLYLEDDNVYDEPTERYIRLSVHHELAHVLLANFAARFSREAWQNLNPPSFHYGNGGLESIQADPDASADLDPASWEEGFAYPYGKSDLDEDVACLTEAIFSGDSRFWKAADRVEVLNKKVKMLIAFYHSLDPHLTEAFFRHLTPFPSATDPAIAPYHGDDREEPGGAPDGSVGRFVALLLLGVFVLGGLLLILFLVFFSYRYSRQARKSPQGPSPWLSTHLWYVVMQNDVVGTDDALSRGADVNACDANGNPLLVTALFDGHLGTARIMLRFQPNPNAAIPQTGITPLMAACRAGAHDIVETLLAAGAAPDVQSLEGAFALGYAAYGAYPEIVSMLLLRGANPHLMDRQGNTALMVARRQFEEVVDPIRKAALFQVLERLSQQ